MSILIESELRRYLIGGVNPPKAASLTGDISQMTKAQVARILQSTSPGLSANIAGSLGEQQQYLVDKMVLLVQQFLKTTANAQSALATGSLAQQIAAAAAGGARKTAGVGYFLIPTGPAVGTSLTAGVANTYGAWTQLIASTAAAIYVVGLLFDTPSAAPQYYQLQIGTGPGASETGVSETKFYCASSNAAYTPTIYFPFPVPVATGTRIAARLASSAVSPTASVTLICINQSNLVAM